jgi:hypothetical protein
MSHVITTGRPAGPVTERTASQTLAALAPGIGVAAIWVATLLFSLFAPDLVSGSQQEHLPIAGLTAWLWAAAATGYVLMATRARSTDDDPAWWLGFELSVAVIWAVVALAGIFTPVLVTGSDPTRIPLAALVAPVAGMVATGFVALHATTRRAPEPR